MILNLRRIGLYSMSLALILTLSITPISRSEDITPFEEFFKGYEKVWEIPKTELLGTIHTIESAENYFSIITKIKSDNFGYYYYHDSGELIWELHDPGIYPIKPALSLSGNRFMMYKHDPKEKNSKPIIYDVEGNLLFEFPISGPSIGSSPTGKFFYSKADFWVEQPLVIVNSIGEIILEKPAGLNWYAEAINDSFLIYDDPNITEVIKITGNGTAEEYSIYKKCGTDIGIREPFPSPTGDLIALKFLRQLWMLDKELKEQYKIKEDYDIYCVSFSKSSSEVFCIYTCNLNNRENLFKFYSHEGHLIGNYSKTFPAGYGLGWDMGFGEHIFISRYSLSDTKTLDRPNIKRYRSLVVCLNSDYNSIISTAVLENKIYPIGESSDLLVVRDTNVTGWSKKGGK